MSRQVRLKSVETILREEYKEGFKNGINEGLRVAERIYGWWQINHQLLDRHSPEKLREWSENALAELKQLLQKE